MAGHKHEMDKGWSWVVLLCSWMSLFLLCCITATAGILQVEIIEDLGVGAGPVSIMTSLALGLASLLGPLSGIMASLLSARVTVFLGTILMSFGMLATSFSYSIPAMMIFYGIITGFGFGIAYSPIVVVISFYFEKLRMLANGIILCASGVGMLSFPFFARYMIDSYGWRFAFAINGGIILHILVFAAAFFPTEMEKMNMIDFSSFCSEKNTKENEKECENDINNTVDEGEKIFCSSGELKYIGIQSKKYDMILKSGLMVDSISQKSKSQNLSVNGSSLNVMNPPYIPTYIVETVEGKRPFQPLSDGTDAYGVCETQLKNGLLLEERDNGVSDASPFRQRTFSELSSRSIVSTDAHSSVHVLPHPAEKYKFGQLRKGSSVGRSYLGSSLGWASSDLGSSMMLPFKIEEVTNRDPEEEKSSIWDQLKRICKHKAVWILSMNSLFFISGYAIHGVHFPSYAESKGTSRQRVAQFYIAFGLVLMVGRLVGGWAFSKFKPPLCTLMFILQFSNGIFMGLAPLYATTSTGIFILQASFGLLYGQSYMVLPAVLAQILGVQDLAIAFGIIHLFMGLGYILAPIIAGFIFDITKTYDVPYYIGGALIVLGALCLILMIFVKSEVDAGKVDKDKVEKKDKLKEEEEDIMKTTPLMAKDKT